MAHPNPAATKCVGCQIPLSDGYVIGCHKCSERRSRRLKAGRIYSPTGYPGEMIDNRDRRGRIVAYA